MSESELQHLVQDVLLRMRSLGLGLDTWPEDLIDNLGHWIAANDDWYQRYQSLISTFSSGDSFSIELWSMVCKITKSRMGDTFPATNPLFMEYVKIYPAILPAPNFAPLTEFEKSGKATSDASREGRGVIYFFLHPVGKYPEVKIGFTAGGLENRLRNAHTWVDDGLQLVGIIPGKTMLYEKLLHQKFADKRSRQEATEWFYLDRALYQFIRDKTSLPSGLGSNFNPSQRNRIQPISDLDDIWRFHASEKQSIPPPLSSFAHE